MGASGEALKRELKVLSPEIYGSINDPERVELEGLLYIIERLPKGIEECQFIKLIAKEGFEESNFNPIIAPKRRRNAYRIDRDQMFIEMTRGRSDIYDILTHLTFMYIESEKVRANATDSHGNPSKDWNNLEQIVLSDHDSVEKEQAYTYLSMMLGRTYQETRAAVLRFSDSVQKINLFHMIYWMGLRSLEETQDGKDRQITFSSALRERVGHHIYGEVWASKIKSVLHQNKLLHRPIHIVSANMHSILNSLFAWRAVSKDLNSKSFLDLVEKLSDEKNRAAMQKITRYALKNGMIELQDDSGMNIPVQIFDLSKAGVTKDIPLDMQPVLVVMDYAFGEQAYETLDELLKPFDLNETRTPLNVESISIMGKAGIMKGQKGDIMVPTSFVFEGTADNYPINNEIDTLMLEKSDIPVYKGPMITVLGTSLQNKDILRYFCLSSWKAIGLDMEGAHYQKAIQAASQIRNSVSKEIKLRYAYYASDNPLETGNTLASGSLGLDGVRPTYVITDTILRSIIKNHSPES